MLRIYILHHIHFASAIKELVSIFLKYNKIIVFLISSAESSDWGVYSVNLDEQLDLFFKKRNNIIILIINKVIIAKKRTFLFFIVNLLLKSIY